MYITHKLSAALVLAALLSGPALAATDTATITNAMQADALPVGNLVAMIGEWTAGDLKVLDTAKAVKVFDTKSLYQANDLKQIASAETAKADQLGKFRSAINGDAALKAWFAAHQLDVSRVIAVADPKGSPEIFLY